MACSKTSGRWSPASCSARNLRNYASSTRTVFLILASAR